VYEVLKCGAAVFVRELGENFEGFVEQDVAHEAEEVKTGFCTLVFYGFCEKEARCKGP
jgi:hypothetical protein